MKTYTYYIEFKTRCAETITIEAQVKKKQENLSERLFRNLTLVELIKED